MEQDVSRKIDVTEHQKDSPRASDVHVHHATAKKELKKEIDLEIINCGWLNASEMSY